MNWKQWLHYDLYKKLWSLVGSRPWTYILRDLWYKFEFIWIIGLIAFGVWMGHNWGWLEVLERMAYLTGGFVLGHLFWGKEIIEGQKDK